MNDTPTARLELLAGYLQADPDNPGLLGDAIDAACAAGSMERARVWAERLGQVLPTSPEGPYFKALIAMRQGDFPEAAAILGPLQPVHDFPNIRFNLAWSLAMIGEKERSLGLLDEKTISTFPAAAMLKVQLFHEAGDFDGALSVAREALRRHPDDAGLCATVGTLALDVEDVELARRCAVQAGTHPEGLAVTGMLEMQGGDAVAAMQTFTRAIEGRQHNPRAWIGRGLARLVLADNDGAAADIDRGASQFGDHIGSWIAAGWAHFLGGDPAAARARFERALAIDPNFAESQGSLAVIDAAEGDLAGARRKAAIARRLDRDSFSAAMAQVVLSQNDPVRAREIVEGALTTPLNEQGLTVASYLGGLARPMVR